MRDNSPRKASDLACELTGVSIANRCPIWAKCRLNPSDPKAPRIYVACLSAYNNGHLHGWWIDADQEPDALWLDIEDMLAESPMDDAEEWAIHDYENFSPICIEPPYWGSKRKCLLFTVDYHTYLEKLCHRSNRKLGCQRFLVVEIDATKRLNKHRF